MIRRLIILLLIVGCGTEPEDDKTYKCEVDCVTTLVDMYDDYLIGGCSRPLLQVDALDIDASDALIADVLRFVATYQYAGVELSGLYQFANPDDDSVIDSENAFLISGMYPIADTKYSVGAQYQYSTTEFNTAGLDDVDIAQYGVIGEYKFTKAAKALAYLANRNTDLGNGIEDQDRLVAGTSFELKF